MLDDQSANKLIAVERRNQYIWLTIYSDLITNLLLLFLSLYALSFMGPDAIHDAVASMKNRLEKAKQTAPWYEEITTQLKFTANPDAPVIAREDRLQMALPGDVLFSPGGGELKFDDQLILSNLSKALKQVPYTVLIEGHTDNTPLRGGRYSSNWELSMARAVAVMEYLTKQEGISPKRIGIAAFGEYQPRYPNDTPANRAKNRRIEISILRYE